MSFIVRTAEQVAEDTVQVIEQGADPRQAVTRALLAIVQAERQYLSEMVEDIPAIEALEDSVDPQILCNLISSKIQDRDQLGSIVAGDETPKIVITIDPVLCTVEEVVMGGEDDLVCPLSDMIGAKFGAYLSEGNARLVLDALARVIEKGEPRRVEFTELVRGHVRDYRMLLMWNVTRTKVTYLGRYFQRPDARRNKVLSPLFGAGAGAKAL